MQFTIVGAGALGTILAAQLIAAGHDVTVVARGRRAAAVRAGGLRVTGLVDMTTACPVREPGEPLADDGVLVFAVKTYQMAGALAACAGVRPRAVFSLANGVMKNEQLGDAYGRERVLGCMANFSGELEADDGVTFTRNVCVHLGGGPAAAEIAKLIDGAGIVARACADIEAVEWSKFVGWVALFALAVVSRQPTGVYLDNASLAAVAVRMIKEMGALAAARGITLVDQSPMPVASIVGQPFDAAVATVRGVGRDFGAEAPGHRMSSLQDFESGRALEVHETLGWAAGEANRCGIGAPTLALVYELVAGLDALPR